MHDRSIELEIKPSADDPRVPRHQPFHELDPVDQALVWFICTVSETWQGVEWDHLSKLQSDALMRMVEAGLVEARLSAMATMNGFSQLARCQCRVGGPCLRLLHKRISHLVPGWTNKNGTWITPPTVEQRMTELRLTDQGALARRDWHLGNDLAVLEIVRGKSPGDAGIRPNPWVVVEDFEIEHQNNAAQPVGQVQLGVTTTRSGKPRMKRSVANPLIAEHLCRKPHDTVQEVAAAVGCSTGLVSESPAWRANQIRLRVARTERCDPIALPLQDYLSAVGDNPNRQIRAHHEAQASMDNSFDERERELFERIREYQDAHPEADPQQVSKALGCSARDVQRRHTMIEELLKEGDPLIADSKLQRRIFQRP